MKIAIIKCYSEGITENVSRKIFNKRLKKCMRLLVLLVNKMRRCSCDVIKLKGFKLTNLSLKNKASTVVRM